MAGSIQYFALARELRENEIDPEIITTLRTFVEEIVNKKLSFMQEQILKNTQQYKIIQEQIKKLDDDCAATWKIAAEYIHDLKNETQKLNQRIKMLENTLSDKQINKNGNTG